MTGRNGGGSAAPHPMLSIMRLYAFAPIIALRRGAPILLKSAKPEPGASLVILAAEIAGGRGLTEFAALAAERTLLALRSERAAALLHSPIEQEAVALTTTDGLLDCSKLHGLLTR